jgi:hypothetical protein
LPVFCWQGNVNKAGAYLCAVKNVFVLLLALCSFFSAVAKEVDPPVTTIKKAIDKIEIDGDLSEASWKEAAVAGPFMQNFPFDSSLAQMQTEARVTFDDKALYISGICYQPKNYIVQSLKAGLSQRQL